LGARGDGGVGGGGGQGEAECDEALGHTGYGDLFGDGVGRRTSLDGYFTSLGEGVYGDNQREPSALRVECLNEGELL
jgi:hypothetical protein